jgi:hypothetical protein
VTLAASVIRQMSLECNTSEASRGDIMLKWITRLCLVSGMLLPVVLTYAQDSADLDSQPIMQMLARVLDTPTNRQEILFNDRLAIEQAYPPAQMPADWAAFENMVDDSSEAIWWPVFLRGGSAVINNYFAQGAGMPAAIGVEAFQITQEMSYGVPPERALQIQGTFDRSAIEAAYTTREYTQEAAGDLALWCPAAGCDQGMSLNLAGRDVSNPFGGDIGRSEPALIGDSVIISSPVLDALTAEADSLAADPFYRSAVAALVGEGALVNAYFMGGENVLLLADPLGFLTPSLSPDEIAALLEAFTEDYAPLPQPLLMVIGDVVTADEQQGRLVLSYATEEAAQAAADLLPQRIASYTSLVSSLSLTELLAERGVTEPRVEVVPGEEGVFSVLLTLPTPKISAEDILTYASPDAGDAPATMPAMIYRLLFEMVLRRDLGWLSTAPLESLEALAGS